MINYKDIYYRKVIQWCCLLCSLIRHLIHFCYFFLLGDIFVCRFLSKPLFFFDIKTEVREALCALNNDKFNRLVVELENQFIWPAGLPNGVSCDSFWLCLHLKSVWRCLEKPFCQCSLLVADQL